MGRLTSLRALLCLFFLAVVAVRVSSKCPKRCSCDDLDVSCSAGNLSVVPIFLNPSVRKLNLSSNAIRALQDGLSFYGELEELDLSANMFRHVGKGQFSSQEKMQTLNLSNNFIVALHQKSFVGPTALQTLDLSRNALEVLEDDAFFGLDSLLELRLGKNKIRSIAAGAFRGLGRLRMLNLEHNLLSSLDPDWMSPMGNLRFLFAAHNGVTGLADDSFKSLSALREVRLSHNRLSDVGQFAFRGSRAVDTLDLSHNLLTSVPTVPLSQMPQLASLDLTGNPVRRLDRSSFHMMFVLETLRLDDMQLLEAVGQHTFVDNVKLRELSLESNPRLEPLPWGIFGTNTAVERISFRDNSKWSTLSPHQIPRSGSLRSLHLSGLPLHCNCSLIWLWELYQRNDSGVELDVAVCISVEASADPAEAGDSGGVGGEAGDPLSVMSPDQLICTSRTGHILIAVSIAVLVTVLVLVLVSVIWYKVREWRLRKRYLDARGGGTVVGTLPSGAILHLNGDDTMVYKEALVRTGSSPTYIPAAAGTLYSHKQPIEEDEGVSSTAADEPFYEVPKYGTSGGGPDDPKSSSADSAGSSKYSSSTTSGFVGSELWEPEYFQQQQHHQHPRQQQQSLQQHGYANLFSSPLPSRLMHSPYYNTTSLHGSPISTSTVTTTLTLGNGGGSISSGSSSSGGGGGSGRHGMSVFYSPSRNVSKYPTGSGTFHLHQSMSPLMQHHADFVSSPAHQQPQQPRRHFTSGRKTGRQPQHRRQQQQQQQQETDMFV